MKKYFFTIALVLLVFNIPVVRVLSVSNRKNLSERIYSRAAFTNGFAISYTHSVNKGRVHDFYRVMPDGKLELYATEFVSYGAGIPEAYETEGAKFRSTESGYIIEDLHRVLPDFLMAVGVIAQHSLVVTDSEEPFKTDFSREFFLKDFFKPQTSLLFEVKRVSILTYFLKRGKL
ncbi:DUF1850 domain-containing protein [uncultured Treponema sp.]|uniref:DUF1850 domain-containing protein n=1 Tax=uncultured Treponema sp. TaxID=162155 RepID=UPI0025FC0D08|nr:DUF1850 domain-containing protein [uncultured Treponema sp.]